MKSISVIRNNSPIIRKNNKDYYCFESYNEQITLASIEIPDLELNIINNKENQSKVLTRKLGFSLNFRDLGIVHLANTRLKEFHEHACYPIGSDFVAIVTQIGSNVTSLKIGDMVIGNNHYFDKRSNQSINGIPTNHASCEYELIEESKLFKVNCKIPTYILASLSIGVQTAVSMIRKSNIEPSDKILICSPSSSTSLFIIFFLNKMGFKNPKYALSTSGNYASELIELGHYEKIYSKQNGDEIKELFDVVFDPFIDVNLPYLVDLKCLNVNSRIISCGVYAQHPIEVMKQDSIYLASFFSTLITLNVSLIFNCLGSTQDLSDGLEIISNCDYISDLNFIKKNDSPSIESFTINSFNLDKNKFGKLSYLY